MSWKVSQHDSRKKLNTNHEDGNDNGDRKYPYFILDFNERLT